MNGSRSAIDEREWESQERAMQAVRLGEAGRAGAADAGYRRLAEAVLSQPRSAPPEDFAAAVADRAAALAADRERLLARVLLALFAAAAAALAALYGEPCWQALRQWPGADARGWIAVGGACVALSWLAGGLLERERCRRAVPGH
ncbi:MAG: hypothetical protein QM601_08470 [Pseudoxanthomonas sp.]